MGFTPAQVRAMTFWEFAHAQTAWARSNGAETIESVSEAELAEVDALLVSTLMVLR